MLLLDDVERRFPFPRSKDIDVPPLEHEPQADRFDNIGLVVDDQDLHTAAPSGGPATGTASVNVLPSPGRLRTSMVPPCAWAIASARGSPSPTLCCGASGSRRPTKKRSKRWVWSSAEIPGPSSVTQKRITPSVGPSTPTSIRPPSGA